MNAVEAVRHGNMADTILRWFAYLVVIVGVVAAVAAVCAGFDATEPWIYGGLLVDEEWMSIALGFLSAAWIVIYTGVVWAVIQAVRVVIWYVTRKAPAID